MVPFSDLALRGERLEKLWDSPPRCGSPDASFQPAPICAGRERAWFRGYESELRQFGEL